MTKRKATGSVGNLIPDCPCCKAFADDTQARREAKVTVFTWEGVTHATPSIWLAGMVLGHQRTPMVEAMRLWVWHCGIEIEQGRAA